MEGNLEESKQLENREDHVLLDLCDVCLNSDIPANAPYILSGLDSASPTLVIGDCLKLVGEYQEPLGTCYLFSEDDTETDLLKGKCNINPRQAPSASKKVKPLASVHRILKFKLSNEHRNTPEAPTDHLS